MMATVMRTRWWPLVVATTAAVLLVAAPTALAAGPVAVGRGGALAPLREVVRTSTGRVYVFTVDSGPPRTLRVYRATGTGIPTAFAETNGVAVPAIGPDVRLGAGDVVHVVYVRDDTGAVVYRTFQAGSDVWGPEEVVTTSAAVFAPGVAVAALGVDSTGTPEVVVADASGVRAFRRSGGAWAADGSALSVAAASNPSVAVDRQDRIVAAWLEGGSVQAAVRSGTGWAAAVNVATGARGGAAGDQGPSVAVDANDTPLVSYTTAAGAFAERIASGGSYSDESPSPAVAGRSGSLAAVNDDRYALMLAGTGPALATRPDGTATWGSQDLSAGITGATATSLRFDAVRDPDCSVIDGVVGDDSGALWYLEVPLAGAASGTGICTALSTGHQTEPTAAFTAKPADPTSTPTAPVAWQTTGAVAEQQCSLDGVLFTACTSPQTVPNTKVGPHSFRVRVANAAGEQIITAQWTATLPVPVITLGATPPDPTESKTATITWTVAGTGAVTCKLDVQLYKACSSPLALSALAAGRHTVTIRAANASGAAMTPPISWTIAPATAPPTVAIDSAPAGLVGPGTQTVTWTTTQAIGSIDCRIDAGAWGSCATPLTVPVLTRGAHTFDVRVTNSLGSATDSASWLVGDPPPGITVTSRPEATTSSTDAAIAWNANGAVSATRCVVDGAAPVACTSPLELSGLAFGGHSVAITVSNGTGAGSAEVDWSIVPPLVTFTDRPGDVIASSSASFAWTVSGSVDTTTCRLDDGPFQPCTSPWGVSGLVTGSHVVTVRATNASGFGQQSVTFTANPPDVASAAVEVLLTERPPAATSSTDATVGWTVSGPATGTTCALDGAVPAACISPFTIGGLPIGDHALTITAGGPSGNATRIVAWRVTGPDPVVTLIGFPDDPTPARSASFRFTVAGDSPTVTCSLDGGVFAPCTSPYTVSGLTAGLHQITVRATGTGGGSSDAGFTWLVADPMRITIASRPPTASALSKATIVWTTSAPATTTTCAVDGAAPDPCASPFVAADLAAGSHVVQIVASGGAGSNTANVSFSTNPDAPIVTLSRVPAHKNAARSAIFAWRISGKPTSVQCRLDGTAWRPCGTTLKLMGLAPGGHTFIVRAWNGFGASQDSFAWAVASAPKIALKVRPAVVTPHREATFRFAISGAVTKILCRIDSGHWKRCGRAIQYLHLKSGWHRFGVRATGPGGTGALRFAWRVV
jgi:hypothetical protein